MKLYKFHYRIEAQAGTGNMNDTQEKAPGYIEMCFEAKKKLSNKERNELVQKFKKDLAERLDIKVWHITSITEQEYESQLEQQ